MISVCIPTYNGEKYLRPQLDSILYQLSPEDEVIISDDSSTDKTCKIIKSYQDPRVHLIENQKFKSPILNLENSLKHTKGDYIFLADQDDVWNKDKVKIMMGVLKNYDLVITDCKLIDKNNSILENSFFKLNNSGKGLFKNLYKNSYMGCCMAFNKKLKNLILPFPKGIAMHDMWIGLNAELFSSVHFCNQQLVNYRRHEGNKTPIIGINNQHRLTYKIWFRIKMLILVIKNYVLKKYIYNNNLYSNL